jgi:membrane dipeptidase
MRADDSSLAQHRTGRETTSPSLLSLLLILLVYKQIISPEETRHLSFQRNTICQIRTPSEMAQLYQSLDIDERVKRVLLNTPLADGHNDLPQQPRCCFQGKIHNNPKFDLEKGFQRGMTDLPRLREGAVGLQFWSICVPHLRGSEDFELPNYNDMCRDALEQIDLSIRMIKSYPKDFELIYGPEDVRKTYQSNKIACSIGLEGLHQAGNSISVIRAYYQLGVRYVSANTCVAILFADFVVHHDTC